MTSVEEEGVHPIMDGHVIHFKWDRDAVKIFRVDCPNVGLTSICNRRRDYCVIERFISVYQAELNIGVVAISGPVEVAWVGMPGRSDLDDEYASIWVVPIDDPDFRETYLSDDTDD